MQLEKKSGPKTDPRGAPTFRGVEGNPGRSCREGKTRRTGCKSEEVGIIEANGKRGSRKEVVSSMGKAIEKSSKGTAVTQNTPKTQ